MISFAIIVNLTILALGLILSSPVIVTCGFVSVNLWLAAEVVICEIKRK